VVGLRLCIINLNKIVDVSNMETLIFRLCIGFSSNERVNINFDLLC